MRSAIVALLAILAGGAQAAQVGPIDSGQLGVGVPTLSGGYIPFSFISPTALVAGLSGAGSFVQTPVIAAQPAAGTGLTINSAAGIVVGAAVASPSGCLAAAATVATIASTALTLSAATLSACPLGDVISFRSGTPTLLAAGDNVFSTVAAYSRAALVAVPANRSTRVINLGVNTLAVDPPPGGQLNGLGVGVPGGVLPGASVIFFCAGSIQCNAY